MCSKEPNYDGDDDNDGDVQEYKEDVVIQCIHDKSIVVRETLRNDSTMFCVYFKCPSKMHKEYVHVEHSFSSVVIFRPYIADLMQLFGVYERVNKINYELEICIRMVSNNCKFNDEKIGNSFQCGLMCIPKWLFSDRCEDAMWKQVDRYVTTKHRSWLVYDSTVKGIAQNMKWMQHVIERRELSENDSVSLCIESVICNNYNENKGKLTIAHEVKDLYKDEEFQLNFNEYEYVFAVSNDRCCCKKLGGYVLEIELKKAECKVVHKSKKRNNSNTKKTSAKSKPQKSTEKTFESKRKNTSKDVKKSMRYRNETVCDFNSESDYVPSDESQEKC